MPLSQFVTLGKARFTAQELATLALQEDQARRRAIRRGDYADAVLCQRERNNLLGLLSHG